VSPILLLGPAPYRLGGKNLAERINGMYPDIRAYAESVRFGKAKSSGSKDFGNCSFEEK
jgi:hypothetical protein